MKMDVFYIKESCSILDYWFSSGDVIKLQVVEEKPRFPGRFLATERLTGENIAVTLACTESERKLVLLPALQKHSRSKRWNHT